MNIINRQNAASLLAAFCILCGPAYAQSPVGDNKPASVANFVTLGDKPAIVYDAPSTKANKTHIFGRLHPLEVLVKLDKWVKVRDTENTVGWVESTALGDKRHIQVSAPSGDIHAMPSATAPIVFSAQRGVLLEATGAAVDGWLPVKHRDGQVGYIALTQIWGF
ncbi:MAG: hypothetical protein JNM52_10930 [Betaproteobacteria bacterium]|nr:hypothetical protein [Betaproteobacteria bacterium]